MLCIFRQWVVSLWVCARWEPGVALTSSIVWRNVCCLLAHSRSRLSRRLSRNRLLTRLLETRVSLYINLQCVHILIFSIDYAQLNYSFDIYYDSYFISEYLITGYGQYGQEEQIKVRLLCLTTSHNPSHHFCMFECPQFSY